MKKRYLCKLKGGSFEIYRMLCQWHYEAYENRHELIMIWLSYDQCDYCGE
jgi:hypothetical protein